MYINIEKPKTRKGLSYIIKTSVIDNALSQRKIEATFYLNFFTPQHFNPTNTSVFEAEFVPKSVGGDQDRFHIRIGVVSASERKIVEQLFLEKALEPFLNFVEHQMAKSRNSTHLGRGFYVKWLDQQLHF